MGSSLLPSLSFLKRTLGGHTPSSKPSRRMFSTRIPCHDNKDIMSEFHGSCIHRHVCVCAFSYTFVWLLWGIMCVSAYLHRCMWHGMHQKQSFEQEIIHTYIYIYMYIYIYVHVMPSIMVQCLWCVIKIILCTCKSGMYTYNALVVPVGTLYARIKTRLKTQASKPDRFTQTHTHTKTHTYKHTW